MNTRLVSFASKRATRESSWALVLVAIITTCLSLGIIVPSIATSMQNGLRGYADATGAYILVQNNGNPAGIDQTLPSSLISQIGNLAGVEKVYPVTTNETRFYFDPPLYSGFSTIGGNTVETGIDSIGVLSGVIGGPHGYPEQFVNPTSGFAPSGNEDAFIYNSPEANPYNVSDIANVEVANINFTATEAGINSYVPLLGNNLQLLWPASFMQNKLGQVLFNQTFGGGTNFLVIKSSSVQVIPKIVKNLGSLLQGYTAYGVFYDQSTVANLVSLEEGTTPLYQALGGLSLSILILVFLFISYIGVRKRAWEFGLLITQGWSWGDVTKSLIFYFIILTGVSLALSVGVSLVVSKFLSSTFQVYGGYLHVPLTIGPGYLIIVTVASVILAVSASYLMTYWLKRSGLDKILRDF
jgi:hypothetical protein